MLIAGYLVGWLGLALSLKHGLDPRGDPPGADFIIFYGVSRLTLAGQAALAYVPHALMAAEREVFPAGRGVFLWTYPPTFQLIVAPLAFAPYLWALAAWTGTGLVAYLATLKRFARDRRAWLLALAFPGVFMNASQGQTGFLMTALLGGGLLTLETRPWNAGILIGLLIVKPQFAVLTPILLLAAWRWRAFVAAATTAIVVILAATAAYGPECWETFFKAAEFSAGSLASGALPLHKDPSVYAALALWGAPNAIALAAHVASAVAATVMAVIVWRSRASVRLKAGVGVMATLITLPYLFDYDLVLLAVPIAVALDAIARREAPDGVKTSLVALAAAPVLIGPVGLYLHIPLGPAALWLGMLTLWRLARNASDQDAVGWV